MAGVPQLVIVCPVAKRPIPVGFEMERAQFESKSTDLASAVTCPECGRVHSWSKRTAALADDVARGRRPS